ncbi:MAG: SpoIIE family protein phosphatase [Clostridia bacterium]|nr:SpoIIE family protein phosphatase [Clostridia bacterium]
MPNSFNIELEEFIGNSKFLPVMPSRALNRSKETLDNLNNVSNVIDEMASGYSGEETLIYDSEEQKKTNKDIFIAELLNNLEPYKENMLYDDVANVEGKIINEIFEYMIDKQEINREGLLQIFAKCNSYIVGFEDKQISKYLEDNISEMVRIINISYKVSKIDFIWRTKEQINKENIGKQLNGVSKAIKKMAKGIEEDIQKEAEGKFEKEKLEIIELLKQKEISLEDVNIQRETDNGRFIIDVYISNILEIETKNIQVIEELLTKILKEEIELNEELTVGNKLSFLSADRYTMTIGTEEITKNQNTISGDSILNIRLKDGKYLIALSDGMGAGEKAKESSNKALKMLENLLLSGFDKNISLDLINSSLMEENKETFATLDIAIIDLYKGNIEFIKSGACPTYIKNGKKVKIIKSNTLPTGIVENSNNTNIQIFDKDIESKDILVMCTDGILDANVEYKNKELWLKYLLEDIETTNTKKIANLIINEAIDNSYGIAKDDMSIIVCKFKQSK